MAKIIGRGKVDFEFTLSLNEAEFNALAALGAYHPDDVNKALETYLSKDYARDNGPGLVSLINSTAIEAAAIRGRVAEAKAAFNRLGKSSS